MKKLKKYYLEILILPFIGNFLYNIFHEKNIGFIFEVNYFNLISSMLLFLILFFIGKALKNTFKLNNISISIVFYFVFLFLGENIFLFLTKNIFFNYYFIISNSLLVVYILFKKKANKEIFYLMIVLITNFNFVKLFEKYLRVIKLVKGDVEYQWFPMAENIYNINYYYSLTNPVIDGYGQLISYVHAVLLKINFNFSNYEYLTSTTNLLFFLAILFFSELNISTKHKIYLSAVYSTIVLNSEWLNYLFLDSIMGEGIVSLFFSIGLYSLFKEIKKGNESNALIFIIFGCLYFTKQFVSILVIFICCLLFISYVKNPKIILALIPFSINEVNLKTVLVNIRRDAYVSDFDFKDTAVDLLTNTNLNIENAQIILFNLFEDRPYTYLLIIFVISNILLLSKKYFDKESIYFLIIFLINLFLIFGLYISAWRNMPELDSPIRYILNLFHLTLIYTFLNFEKYVVVLSESFPRKQ